PPAGGELVLDEALPEDAEPDGVDSPRDALALEDALSRASDRDAAARVAIALARRYARAAALFVVHRGMVMGLVGAGEGLESRVDGLLVPPDAEGVLARVAATGEPFRGFPPDSGLDLRVLRGLARSQVREIALLPIAIRERVVNVLYVDDGPRPLSETRLGALRALTECIARAYENLILQRKRGS